MGSGSEAPERQVAVDFVDGAVAVDEQLHVGEGGGEFFFQAADHFRLELFLELGGNGVEGGDAGLDDVAGAVLRADADGEGGAEVEEAVVFAVGRGEGRRAVGMALEFLAGAFGFELGIDLVEDLLQPVFPAFEFGFWGGHGSRKSFSRKTGNGQENRRG